MIAIMVKIKELKTLLIYKQFISNYSVTHVDTRSVNCCVQLKKIMIENPFNRFTFTSVIFFLHILHIQSLILLIFTIICFSFRYRLFWILAVIISQHYHLVLRRYDYCHHRFHCWLWRVREDMLRKFPAKTRRESWCSCWRNCNLHRWNDWNRTWNKLVRWKYWRHWYYPGKKIIY